MAIGEALKAANNAHNERRAKMEKGRNAARNKAVAARWVGGESGSRLTAEELRVRLGQLKAECVERRPEWFKGEAA